MSDDEVERTEAGDRIYRHKARERGWTPPEHAGAHLEEVEAHVEKHLGKIETVYHEIVSDLVHLDVLFVPADADRPFHVLITSGVSDEPMNVPEGLEQFRYAELLCVLPADWSLDQDSFHDENIYWPIRWLKQIGRLPHEYETWIGWGHTIPNGDPAEPIANTQFTGVMLSLPYWLPPEFVQLKTRAGETITFYQILPLYQEEMDLKLKKGAEALEKLFEKKGVDFVLDPDRTNVAVRKGWFR